MEVEDFIKRNWILVFKYGNVLKMRKENTILYKDNSFISLTKEEDTFNNLNKKRITKFEGMLDNLEEFDSMCKLIKIN